MKSGTVSTTPAKLYEQNMHITQRNMIQNIVQDITIEHNLVTVFARVICALFSILATEKSGCVKYADFFLWRS